MTTTRNPVGCMMLTVYGIIIPFLPSILAGTAFIFCKLAEVTAIAKWSWAKCTCPLWGYAVYAVALFVLFVVTATICSVRETTK